MNFGEKLFLAVGHVEDSRLERSELEMKKGRTVPVRRVLLNLLAAVLILTALAATAFAVGSYLIYDSPEALLTAIFGDKTGFDHGTYQEVPDLEQPGSLLAVEPEYDRVPADTKAVEELAPHVSPVGKSITFHGVTLTVDAYLYDSATQCGIITYLLEYPDGIPAYNVSSDGQFDFDGDSVVGVQVSQYGYHYLIKEKTTDKVLALQYYFKYDSWHDEELYLQAYYQAPGTDFETRDQRMRERVRAEYSPDEAITAAIEYAGDEYFENYAQNWQGYADDLRTEAAYAILRDRFLLEEMDRREDSEKIVLDVSRSSEVGNVSLGGGTACVSPISLQIQAENLDYLLEPGIEPAQIVNVHSLSVRFTDGTEYQIVADHVENLIFWRASPPSGTAPEDCGNVGNTQMTVMFNRLIDLDQVAAVVINGQELPRD